MKLSLIGSLLFSATMTLAQPNLVPNPSFEKINKQPIRYSKNAAEFDAVMNDWSTTNKTSPDVITPNLNDKTRSYEIPEARTGESMVGLINNLGWWTEYVSTALKTPIKKDHEYYAEFWVMVLENKNLIEGTAPSKLNPNFGIWFHNGATFTTKNLIKEQPQMAHEGTQICPHNTWIKISGTFMAEEDYTHLCLGQFDTDLKTQLNGCLLIDDVVVRETGKVKMEVGATIVLENVMFKSGTAILETESYEPLNELYQSLFLDEALSIAISGHTDNVGSELDNQVLSQARAKAIYTYLIEKGIAENRLQYKGTGESKPIASNDTSSGRKRNRRVEFEIL